jgi:hypothetical protein
MNHDLELTKVGLALVDAAWLTPEDGPSDVLEAIASHLDDDPQFEWKAVVGLVNVVNWLITWLADETDRSAGEILENMRARLIQES